MGIEFVGHRKTGGSPRAACGRLLQAAVEAVAPVNGPACDSLQRGRDACRWRPHEDDALGCAQASLARRQEGLDAPA
jgi:hypothetical protein